MPRDYKHRGGSKRKARTQAPGWLWMLGGLAIGLSVAAGVYVYDRATLPATVPVPAPRAQPASASAEPDPGQEQEADDRTRYDFYDMLPNFEVIIPEREPVVANQSAEQPVKAPGAYILQAGSFQRYADAERRKATLALQGLTSKVQRVTIDNDQVWHRVRIGPITELSELNETRRLLAAADVDFLMIKVGD